MKNVLVVDDEPLLRMVVVETLREAGFSAQDAPDGFEALKILNANPGIEVLVSDVKMPRMDGYQLVSQALALKPDLKVVMMTGYSGNASRDVLLPSGCVFLNKPFNLDELPKIIGGM
jgi:CheY-like chemotaxis protein